MGIWELRFQSFLFVFFFFLGGGVRRRHFGLKDWGCRVVRWKVFKALVFCEGLEALEGLHGLRFGGLGLLIFGLIIGI